ncbi:hypothetical protein D918_07496 [Trichuris suis]|nr:hypothetical protein D918_07496 [Trichuris suis]
MELVSCEDSLLFLLYFELLYCMAAPLVSLTVATILNLG